ncbi:MAG: hypothetical protein AB7Q81_23820 [Gammaproteobacteria bacterium]
MNRAGFTPNLVVGAALALVTGIVFNALLPGVSATAALRIALGLAATGYALWLVASARTRTGRVVLALAWLAGALLAWLLEPPLTLYLAGHVGAAWLLRALFHHVRPGAAVADLALATLALGAGLVAARHTASVTLGAWSFFLVQALWVFIPGGREEDAPPTDESSRFAQAAARARAAWIRLQAHH